MKKRTLAVLAFLLVASFPAIGLADQTPTPQTDSVPYSGTIEQLDPIFSDMHGTIKSLDSSLNHQTLADNSNDLIIKINKFIIWANIDLQVTSVSKASCGTDCVDYSYNFNLDKSSTSRNINGYIPKGSQSLVIRLQKTGGILQMSATSDVECNPKIVGSVSTIMKNILTAFKSRITPSVSYVLNRNLPTSNTVSVNNLNNTGLNAVLAFTNTPEAAATLSLGNGAF